MTDGTQNVHPFSTRTYFLIQTPLPESHIKISIYTPAADAAVGRHLVRVCVHIRTILTTTNIIPYHYYSGVLLEKNDGFRVERTRWGR